MGVSKPWDVDITVYDEESELLAGLRRGEPFACTCLLKRFAPRLYRLALHLMGDADEAEDVLQEAFISACAHIGEFDGRSGLGTWLHRIVRNAALGRLRRQHRWNQQVTTDPSQLAAVPDPATRPADQVLHQELGAVLEAAVVALPLGTRAAFVLRDVEGLTTAEAAVDLGISESAVKVRLHRARQALRASLASAGVHDDPADRLRAYRDDALPAAQISRLERDVCAARPVPPPG